PGIPNTLFAISKRKGMIKKHNLYSSIITSAFTVGFGGSAGLESPAVGTTSGFSSYLGSLFRLNYKTRTLLIGCAAAGAMASLFKAPVAAIVFAIEVIMLDLTTASMIPLLLASASAALTSQFFLGEDVLFHFDVEETLSFRSIPYYLPLGITCGLLSVYFSKVYFLTDRLFGRIEKVYHKVVVGGVILGLLLFLMPPLYGEGYGVINQLLEGDAGGIMDNSLFADRQDNFVVLALFMIAVVLFKAVATSVTLRAGGIGGIFAPALFTGSFTGFIFARFINHWNLGNVSESNFILVGMAGFMAGILHAPLTAIFLIAEITGGYELFIPLMITAAIAYLTTKYTLPYSVYTMQLAKRGALITHDKDQAVLTLMQLHKEIETNFETVDPYQTLGDLVQVIARSSRNLFPVVDREGYFLGTVMLNDVRDLMFKKELYDKTYVHNLMSDAAEQVSVKDNMDMVMKKFESSGAWNLPVLQDGKYVGFVSKSKLFSAYRSLLRDFYDDSQ
ncbi:MAG: chloride channel protein, partial [Bacteroidota bacterium]